MFEDDPHGKDEIDRWNGKIAAAGEASRSNDLLAAADYHDEVAKAASDNAEMARYTRADFDFWCQKRRTHQKWADAIREAANNNLSGGR